ncbi:MAG TPA: methyltransferase domain-containing protein [Spirochaetota bacterium]|nr:methyltransferase domain-containing protein [Spirochaetota bacterium]
MKKKATTRPAKAAAKTEAAPSAPSRKGFFSLMKKLGASKGLLAALEKYDRAAFFDPIFRERLFADESLPVGAGEYAETPSTLARMIGHARLKKSARVLEGGTGSGYSTAILSGLAHEVISIEISGELAAAAKTRHERMRIRNTRFFAGDGTDPDEELGLFDAVIVWAACHARPLILAAFLNEGGRLVFPMGPFHQQQIAVYTRDGAEAKTAFHEYCAFPPVRGRYGTDLLNRETVMANFSLEEEGKEEE